MFNFLKPKFSTGCLPDPVDSRDRIYDEVAAIGEPVDWGKGFDVEKELGVKTGFKNQDGSSSCVGQGWSYYIALLNALETGSYKDVSAKSIYSQIFIDSPSGGAYIRDGGKLIVNWGALFEGTLPSYDGGRPPKEAFMRDRSWKSSDMDRLAKILRGKEYRRIGGASDIDLYAMAIRDNYGTVGGVKGDNSNNSWRTFEPQPPKSYKWGHCLFFGKFGVDKLGKYIATPNSWGSRGTDKLHPDGWQKLRENYFNTGNMFNAWTLLDKPNEQILSGTAERIIKNYEKKIVMEGEGKGRIGIIINGKLSEVLTDRRSAASLYVMNNNGYGITVKTSLFDELPSANKF